MLQQCARLASIAFILSLMLSGCTTYEYHETVEVPINKLSEEQELSIEEDLFLDVGVVLFDHGVDELDDELLAYLNVRKSEAVWYTSQLKTTLDRSNAWGLVRALPGAANFTDVIVKGKLLDSNGERVALQISVTDSAGELWYQKDYEQTVSQYAYNPEVNLPGDPFQAMFNNIANDLFDYRKQLSDADLRRLRSTTKVLFAREFVPAAFSDYFSISDEGQQTLVRLPSSQDPFMQKVDRIRSRNDLFLDVVQDYYRAFNQTMGAPYQEWRKLSYKEVVRERQLREQARKEKIASVVAIAGGVAATQTSGSRDTQIAGAVGAFYASRLFGRSFLKTQQAQIHSETLREMGQSLELELESSVVDLQDRSITLSGTVDDQFAEWRRILSRMFELEENDKTASAEVSLDESKPITEPSIESHNGVLEN